MRKIALTVLMMGMTMNVYGAEAEDKPPEERKKSLVHWSDPSYIDPYYPECSQHIRAEIQEAYEEGKQKVKIGIAIRMFKKGGIYTPKFIEEITDITEEQLREALAKEEHK